MIKQYFSTGVLISKACKKGATISEQQAKKKFRFLDPVELNMKSSFAGKEMLPAPENNFFSSDFLILILPKKDSCRLSLSGISLRLK